MPMPSMPETFSARLVRSSFVTPRVKALVFERVDGRPFIFEAGQWVSLRLPLLDERQRPVRRSYSVASVASVPGGSPRFELVVTKVDGGVGSSWLHEVSEGVVLEVKGPQGLFRLGAPAPSLFVATGTGIAPIRGMLHQALARGGAAPLWVLFGARTSADVLYREELEGLAKAHARLRLELTLSRPDDAWTGRRGYVQGHVVELWSSLSAFEPAPHAYVCGVKKMLAEVRDVLRVKLGVERQRVHVESYD